MGIKKASGQAKVFGTLICVGGAMLLSFYHGHIVGIGESSIHWNYAEKMTSKNGSSNSSDFLLGSFLVLVSAVAWAIWLIIQVINYKTTITYTVLWNIKEPKIQMFNVVIN